MLIQGNQVNVTLPIVQSLFSSLLSPQSFNPAQAQKIGMHVPLLQRNWFIGHTPTEIKILMRKLSSW